MSIKLNRWRIEGTLTTISPLHIGSGDTVTRPGQITDEKKKKDVEIAGVAKDCNNKPYLPGATIKGNLRAYVEQTKQDKKIIEKLFGSLNPQDKHSCGGALEFWNVKVQDKTPTFSSQHIPYWEDDSLTGVTASAVIDRQTRTAADKKLFYTEYVPSGITFAVVITGQDLDNMAIALLLYALNGFNTKKVKLGASEADGWGEFEWKLDTVTYIDLKHIKDWIQSPGELVGYNMTGLDRTNELKNIVDNINTSTLDDFLTLEMTLTFNSPFLVNDTSRDRDLKDDSGRKKFGDHYPLVDSKGKVILPSKSIRGAFRSQAEKILRTLGNGQSACFDHDKADRKACGSVYKVDKVKESCPACQVFGLSGWRSPVEFSDFTFVQNGEKGAIKRQQFVAIDRFTGGGAEGAKFDADYADRPKLSGTMSIDIDRLRTAGAEDWGLGLIALTLRDLIDGDITLGFGASKGYGSCTTEIKYNLDELKNKLNSMRGWHENLIKELTAQSSRRIL